MRELIIGMDGFIGQKLCEHLPDAMRTTRDLRKVRHDTIFYFDMLEPVALPAADIVYLCAGINGNLTCAQHPQISYRTNVDGTIWVAEHCQRTGAFMVWISSTTVEWLRENYGVQKREAETYLRALPHVGMVRAGRVIKTNIDDLCAKMIDIGRNRRHEVVLWNEDEKPYQH